MKNADYGTEAVAARRRRVYGAATHCAPECLRTFQKEMTYVSAAAAAAAAAANVSREFQNWIKFCQFLTSSFFLCSMLPLFRCRDLDLCPMTFKIDTDLHMYISGMPKARYLKFCSVCAFHVAFATLLWPLFVYLWVFSRGETP